MRCKLTQQACVFLVTLQGSQNKHLNHWLVDGWPQTCSVRLNCKWMPWQQFFLPWFKGASCHGIVWTMAWAGELQRHRWLADALQPCCRPLECIHQHCWGLWKRHTDPGGVPKNGLVAGITQATFADGSPLNPVQATQIGLVRRLARKVISDSTSVWHDGDRVSGRGPLAGGPGTGAIETAFHIERSQRKILKMSGQSDDSELVPPNANEVNTLLQNYHTIMGAMPEEAEEPSPNQLAALSKRVHRDNAPRYVDFGVFGPFERKLTKVQRCRIFTPLGHGTYLQRDLPGPATYQGWLAAWRVFKTACLMLNISKHSIIGSSGGFWPPHRKAGDAVAFSVGLGLPSRGCGKSWISFPSKLDSADKFHEIGTGMPLGVASSSSWRRTMLTGRKRSTSQHQLGSLLHRGDSCHQSSRLDYKTRSVKTFHQGTNWETHGDSSPTGIRGQHETENTRRTWTNWGPFVKNMDKRKTRRLGLAAKIQEEKG